MPSVSPTISARRRLNKDIWSSMRAGMQYSKSPPGAAKPGYGAASMSEAFMAKDGARVDGDAMEGLEAG
jgi:hypothetical protein